MKIIASWLSVMASVFVLAATAFGTGDEGRIPPLNGAVTWLNTAPLNSKSLRGKVVLVNFWTYSCINSLRELPYLKAWAAKYKDAGLVVIGVHTPEFGFEKDPANVKRRSLTWESNSPFRSIAIIPSGRPSATNTGLRTTLSTQRGEFVITTSAKVITRNPSGLSRSSCVKTEQRGQTDHPVRLSATGTEAPPSEDVRSPETYAGYQRVERFASGERLAARFKQNLQPATESFTESMGAGRPLSLIGPERTHLQAAPGKVKFCFHARDLHMVLGPAKSGLPLRFKVTLNGAPPGEDHGVDSGPDGMGEILQPRLYQLIRRKGGRKTTFLKSSFSIPAPKSLHSRSANGGRTLCRTP